ncbi:MAG: carbonic anhydrase [Planctomycetota bacterium]|jgi:carbonic anhydrase
MTDPAPTFATALNCMDGRVQLPANEAVRSLFGVDHVDTITEAGIVRFLSDETDSDEAAAALSSVRISLAKHGSRAIAVAAHQDCAGNPCSDSEQQEQLRRAVAFLKGQFADCKVVGLWIGDDWTARVVASDPPA